jgi:hypothetical protein
MQKPETKLIRKVQKILKEIEPSIEHWKHADKFNAGIADVHMIMAGGHQAWIEFKWVPSITRKRQVDVTELQTLFLYDHAVRQLPAYVMVGSPKGLVCIHISDFNGYVLASDFSDLRTACTEFIQLLKEGSWVIQHGMWKLSKTAQSAKDLSSKMNST